MSTLIDIVGWTLVHFVWQGAVIALAASAALRLFRSASPQIRYAIACAALAAMMASPAVTATTLSAARPSIHTFDVRLFVAASGVTATTPAPRRLVVPPGATAASQPMNLGLTAFFRLIVVLWFAGVALLVIRLAGGWWRIRRWHRASLDMSPSCWQDAARLMARRLGLERGIHVVDSILVDTPLVIGWLRPVILLPIAALANLTPGQVEAVLAHELAHVRRHDFLVNLLQTVAETVLFYHPAVWWVSARIRTEREHCCDLVAVDACGDAVGYAEALAALETTRAGQTTFAMAAASGSLVDRVRRVLALGASARPRPPSAAIVAGLVLMFIVLASALQYVPAIQAAVAQAPPTALPRTIEARRMLFDRGSGQLRVSGFTGRELIRFAYQVPQSRILGGPDWLDVDTFDITTTIDQAPGAEEMPRLARELLEERFNLAAHRETREFPAYALVIARRDGVLGPHLRPATGDCVDAEAVRAGKVRRDPRIAGRRVCGHWDDGLMGPAVEGFTMSDLAAYLSRPGSFLDRPVVNRTGLDGLFDAHLEIFAPAVAVMSQYPAAAVPLEALGFQSLRSALSEQLGLRLEETSAATEVVLIDRVERPVVSARTQSQATAASGPAFEVASVKANKSGEPFVRLGMAPGGRFTATNVPLRLLIRNAYGLQDFQIIGPDWITSDRFDIVAKAEGDVPPTPPGTIGPIQLMLRSLLAERFQLAAHNETRDLPIYALVLARSDGRLGPQMQASQVDCAGRAAARGRGGPPPGPPPAPPQPGERPPCGMFMGPASIAAGGVTIAQLAQTLSQRVNRVVVDKTGLTGLYEFNLEFTPDQMPNLPPGGAPPGAPGLPPIDPNAPSVFTAVQEQLGLKLDSQRGSVEVLVIDRVEQPTPD